MGIRFKDLLISFIPFKKLRKKMRLLYGTYPYCSISKDIKIGMTVYVPSIDNEATIVSLPDKKDKVMVQSGIIKLAVHISNLEKIPEKKNEVNVKINNMIKSKSKDITTEIKLLGMTVQEAIAELELNEIEWLKTAEEFDIEPPLL